MNDAELNKALLLALPELRQEFIDFVGCEDATLEAAGPVYGNTLGPWLARRIECTAEAPNDDSLRRAFDLIEVLAQQPDGSAANHVLIAWVFHWLFWSEDQIQHLERYRKFMGDKTIHMARLYSPDPRFDETLG